MPKRCAFGCEPTDAPVHRFPNFEKYPERFKEWVTLCGGQLNVQSDYEDFQKKIVCDRHFTENDHNRYKRLNALAVPSLYLTESQASVIAEMSPYGSTQASAEAQWSMTSSKPPILKEHNYTAASKSKYLHPQKERARKPGFNTYQVNKLSSQIKKLQSEMCRLKQNGDFKNRLSNSYKLQESVTFQRVVARMAKPSQLFVNMQLKSTKSPKGRRFTIEEKVLSLSLFKKSPKCYTLLHKYFTLPSVKTMKRLLAKIKIGPGINSVIFEKIKKSLNKKSNEDKLCSLAFDEMSLSAQINYNDKKDTIEGFASNKGNDFADHVLVFMVKGIKQNFKQPVAYFFTNRLNKLELKELIKTVIHHTHSSGLIVKNTVCDQSTVNVSAINELVQEQKSMHLRRGKPWQHDYFLVNGRAVIPLFDTPHLIKGIRNNLLTKDMLYTTKNVQKTVKWEFYQKVYEADKSYGELKLLHKLTEEHVTPEKINKMRVKTATQVFSHSVAVVTEHLTARGDLPEECRQLVDITLIIDNLFDSLNVSTLYVPDGKIYKGPVKQRSPHHEMWIECKKVLKTVKFLKKQTTRGKIRLIETTVPSIINLIKTIEGIEAIWQTLSKKYGFDAMLTRNFNQDPVENFFGNIRSYGARNNAPNTISFEGAFKALLLNNYSAPHSRKANCEEDANDCLQNLDFFLRENYCNDTKVTPDIPEETISFTEELYSEVIQKEDKGQRSYVCGWVLTKCLKRVCKTCQQCRQTLLTNKSDRTSNSYIKTKEYMNKRWLCYPSKELTNCFYDIQSVTKAILKKNAPKKNIKKIIINYCDLLINYPFKCEAHMESIKSYFINTTISVIIYSWCRSVNRILAGKIRYEDDDETKIKAVKYFNKFKHYKNKK